MKRLLICTILALLTFNVSSAFAEESAEEVAEESAEQEEKTTTEEEPIAIGFDLLPYVGTSSAAPDRRRNVSLNLGGGLSGGINSFEIAAGFNIATGEVRGAQLAGGFNIDGADVRAAQFAGGFNVVGGSVDGVQAGGGFNVTGGDINGVQAAGGFNVTGGDVDGVQAGGGFNVTGGTIDGAQLAGGFNLAGEGVDGVQIAPINIAGGHVAGAQIGVINIAKSADAGVGIIGIYTDGYVQAEALGSDDGLMMGGIRHGSGSFYNVYYVGTRPFADEGLPLAMGLGFGWRAEIGSRAEFSIDLMGASVTGGGEDFDWDDNYSLIKLRPMVSVDLVDGLALFGGPTATVLLDGDTQNTSVDDLALLGGWELADGEGDEPYVGIWPGFTVGARFF
ncbi:hypothetical protein FIV42_01590 [Persicimonas caeni]|uniref:Uncharacterized protein n=1 Tax=Persicimonas caeni TaxID=2292766 RepID=A0A4Y6PMD7_PERCE|nr:hypothetical protein [Persicimonas caeni]QDG49476.1 hypothetical protein FIV42_01590 [Persicimonas caeni]QED30697.1 hypothetical protein FRD00_01585 [Persicimonas caeni]